MGSINQIPYTNITGGHHPVYYLCFYTGGSKILKDSKHHPQVIDVEHGHKSKPRYPSAHTRIAEIYESPSPPIWDDWFDPQLDCLSFWEVTVHQDKLGQQSKSAGK